MGSVYVHVCICLLIHTYMDAWMGWYLDIVDQSYGRSDDQSNFVSMSGDLWSLHGSGGGGDTDGHGWKTSVVSLLNCKLVNCTSGHLHTVVPRFA